MKELRCTLLSDGVSDQALLPLLKMLLTHHLPGYAFQMEWADLRQLTPTPKSLVDRISRAVELFPCDLLFVHRDAEREPWEKRITEIRGASTLLPLRLSCPTVCVVPIRMQEAWLLFDEDAIRWAAGNKNGKMPLQMPSLSRIEDIPDPKTVLHELLRTASGLTGRRRRDIPIAHYSRRVADFIEDIEPLRKLSAFQAMETEVVALIKAHHW